MVDQRYHYDASIPKVREQCVRLMIDFATPEELLSYVRETAAGAMRETLHVYKATGAQYHSITVGNCYVVRSDGYPDLKLTKDRIATAYYKGDRKKVDVPNTEYEDAAEDFPLDPIDKQ